MAWYEFLWIDAVLQKLSDSGIDPAEVEEVVCHPFSQDVSRTTGLPVAFGWLSDGRYIIVCYREIGSDTVQVVTAFPVPEPVR